MATIKPISVEWVDNSGGIRKSTFDQPYGYQGKDGKFDPAISILRVEQNGRDFITGGEYDTVTEAYKKLDADDRKIMTDHARKSLRKSSDQTLFEKLPNDKKREFLDRLNEAKLNLHVDTLQIIEDYSSGGDYRQMPVYSVNGHPVIAQNMTSRVVGFYSSANLFNASPERVRETQARMAEWRKRQSAPQGSTGPR